MPFLKPQSQGLFKFCTAVPVSWKITPLYFLAHTSYILWSEKTDHQSEIWGLLSDGVKIHKVPHVLFKTADQFFFKIHHSLVSRQITLLNLLSWNFILFWQKEPIKMPNFRLLISPNLYLDRLLLLKVYKMSAKKVQRSCELCLMTLKIDAKFEEKIKNLVNFDRSTHKSQKFTLWFFPSMKSM